MFLSVRIGISQSELQAMGIGVIHEGWRMKGFGRGKRAWDKEFTPEEKEHIERRFYPLSRYTLPPNFYVKDLYEQQLLVRACNFFGITVWEKNHD
jgi:hypothetical protein